LWDEGRKEERKMEKRKRQFKKEWGKMDKNQIIKKNIKQNEK